MCIRRTRYMHRVFKRGFNFGLFSILFSFFLFSKQQKKAQKHTKMLISDTFSSACD